MQYRFTCLFVALFLVGMSSALQAEAQFVDQQNAFRVLGTSSWGSASAGTSDSSLRAPNDVCIDPGGGKMYVVDTGNHRVLRFSYPPAQNGQSAEAVFGQVNFNANALLSASDSTFNLPYGCAMDSGGRLWVADTGNHRVLRFENARTKPTGASADGVLEQSTFTASSSATAANRFDNPFGLTVGNDGVLYVADMSNRRVLRFNDAATKLDGANADAVFGQVDFISKVAVATAKGMQSPVDVGFHPLERTTS